jgi:NitT/TauT family transport system substrate-binding protein
MLRRALFLHTAAAGGAALLTFPAFVRAAAPVRVGILGIVSDAPFFIADKKGYFKDEGIEVAFSTFASSGNMVVPMNSDQLDAGGGAPTAGIYNGYARGITVKIVADKGTDARGYGFDALLVRSDLVTSGKFKTPADLRGLNVASNQPGSPSGACLFELLRTHGLGFSDVHVQNLDYPDHVAALGNGKVDASITAEPFATRAVMDGSARRVLGDDAWYPDQQLSVVNYSDAFSKRTDDATRFMRAVIRASRFYFDALSGGHLAGPNAGEVIAILTETTNLKDPAIYRRIYPSSLNPDGKLNLASMRKDLAYFKNQGLVTGTIRVEDVVDESFVTAAVRSLGPHKRA